MRPLSSQSQGGHPRTLPSAWRGWENRRRFIGKVGADEFGQGFINRLRQEGVDTTGVLTDPEALTTLALVALSAQGDPHFAFAAGAHTRLTPEEVPQDLIRAARIVQFGSVSLAHEPVRTATLFAQRLAYEVGSIVVYDVNWRPFLYQNRPREEALATLREPLPWCHVVKLNAGELRLLTDCDAVVPGLARLSQQTPAPLIIVDAWGSRVHGAIA